MQYKLILMTLISSLVFFLPSGRSVESHPSTLNELASRTKPLNKIKADLSLVSYLEPKTTPRAKKPATTHQIKPKTAFKGNCESWIAGAGIPLTHATRTLILNESGCKWWAVNPSSGACGIGQSYPCSKMKCPLTEAGAVCQLKWMDQYIKNRYTTWENALAMWQSRYPHWY